MAWETMTQTASSGMVLLQILLMHFVLPAIITLIVSELMRKKNVIKFGDMALDL